MNFSFNSLFDKGLWGKLLIFSVFTIFIGRAYQYIFWMAPYDALIWSQSIIEPFLFFFNTDWNSYTHDLRVDNMAMLIAKIHGFIFATVGIILIYFKEKAFKKILFKISFIYVSIHILILCLLTVTAHYSIFFSFFEHSIQMYTPIMAYIVFTSKKTEIVIENYALKAVKIITALTFLSHGTYALGLHPVPGKFIDMTILILNCSESTARLFLQIVGALDVVVAIGVFVPKVNKYIFLYAAIWGISTALARVVAFHIANDVLIMFHQNIYQVIYRLAHGFIPFVGYLLLRNKTSPKA